MIYDVKNELKVVRNLSGETMLGRASSRINRASLEEMITVGVDFGVEDVKETAFNAKFVFELFARGEQMVNVSRGIRIGNFDVSGENDGQVVAHVLSEFDDALGLLGKLGKFFVRIFSVVPLVVEGLFVNEGVVKAVDADNGNVPVRIIGGDFLNGAIDFVECVHGEKIFPVGVVGFLKAAPRQGSLIVDVKDDGCVGVKGLEGEGFAGGGLSVDEDRSSH